MNVINDLLAAMHAAVREYRRRRWVRHLVRQADLPF